MNVVFPGNERGGAATHIVAFAKAVTAYQLQAHISFLSLGTGPLLDDLRGISDVDVINGSTRARVGTLRRMIRSQGDETLWHAHGPRTNVLLYAARLGAGGRWTSTVHSDPEKDFLGSRFKSLFFTKLNLFCLSHSAGVFVGNSKFAQYLPGLKWFYVPNAIERDRPMVSRDEAREALARRLSVAKDSVFIGVVARLDPVKDIGTAIRALGLLQQRNLGSTHLVVAGPGQQQQELEEIARENGVADKVHFLGFVQDVGRLYPAFDVHVLPSKSEGESPFVILEAGLHGVPNIGSDIPGIRNLIADNVTGKLFPVGDAMALAEALLWVVGHREAALEQAKVFSETVLPRFSHDAMLDAYVTGYKAMGVDF